MACAARKSTARWSLACDPQPLQAHVASALQLHPRPTAAPEELSSSWTGTHLWGRSKPETGHQLCAAAKPPQSTRSDGPALPFTAVSAGAFLGLAVQTSACLRHKVITCSQKREDCLVLKVETGFRASGSQPLQPRREIQRVPGFGLCCCRGVFVC